MVAKKKSTTTTKKPTSVKEMPARATRKKSTTTTTAKKTTKVKPSDLGTGMAAISAKQVLTARQRRDAQLAKIMGRKQKPRKGKRR